MSHHCASCDPILHAQPIICGACSAESYPADAIWLDDGTILASYDTRHEPDCPQRTKFGTVLIRPDSDQQIPDVHRPRLCRATAKTTQNRCKSPAQPGSAFCYAHGGRE